MSYQSAHDLPSFQQMSQQLLGMKLLRFLIPKDQRSKLKELETELRFMGDTIDKFYAILGERNWIFHEHLPLNRIAQLLDDATDANKAEQELIDHYRDPEMLGFFVLQLRQLEALRKRMPLIQRAKDDYLAGRYYATIHVLIAVMDGFVNEFEALRRGLHAREADELNAWDSVVGHHLGLTNAHRTFTKSISVTQTEPVYELYRNGIVHGTLLDYDNVIVATKAWNRLFAIMDWAKSREKEQKPTPPKPTWSELFAQLTETERRKRANESWTAQHFTSDADGFAELQVVLACQKYLDLWRQRNYGHMAQLTSHDVRSAYGSKLPGTIKQEYRPYRLREAEVLSVDHSAPAICIVEARLDLELEGKRIVNLRWIHENEAGEPTASSLDGAWGLIVWGPAAFMHRQ